MKDDLTTSIQLAQVAWHLSGFIQRYLFSNDINTFWVLTTNWNTFPLMLSDILLII